MRVIDTLAGQVTEKLEKQFLALVGVAEVALRCRHRTQDVVKSFFCAVRIAAFKFLESHGDIAAVAAPHTAKSLAIVAVIVIQHQSDFDPFEGIHDLAQRAAQDIKKDIGTGRAHVTFGDQRVANAAIARCRTQIGPVIQREHNHRLTIIRQTGAYIAIDVSIVCIRAAAGYGRRRNGECQQKFGFHGIPT